MPDNALFSAIIPTPFLKQARYSRFENRPTAPRRHPSKAVQISLKLPSQGVESRPIDLPRIRVYLFQPSEKEIPEK